MRFREWITYVVLELLHTFRAQPHIPVIIALFIATFCITDPRLLIGVLCSTAAVALAIGLIATPARRSLLLLNGIAAIAVPAFAAGGLLLIQILPTGFLGISHSLWLTVDQAVGPLPWYCISIAPSITAEVIVWVLMLTTAALAALLTGSDRTAARVLFFACGALAVLWSTVYLVRVVFETKPLIAWGNASYAIVAALVGTVISAAETAYSIRRLLKGQLTSTHGVYAKLVFYGISFPICVAAFVACGGSFAALSCCLLVVATLAFLRRLIARPLEAGLMLFLIIGATLALIFNTPPDIMVTNGSALPPEWIELIRTLRPLGFGAGTLPAFREIYSLPPSASHASTAIILSAEIGWPATVTLALTCVSLGAAIAWMSLGRGRDWQIPASAAALLISLTVEALYSNIMQSAAPYLLVGTITSLGLAQSQSASELDESRWRELSVKERTYRRRWLTAASALALVTLLCGIAISASWTYATATGKTHAIAWLTPLRSNFDTGANTPATPNEDDLAHNLQLNPVNGASWLQLAKIKQHEGELEQAKAALLLAFDTAPARSELILARMMAAIAVIGDKDVFLEYSMRRDLRRIIKSPSGAALFDQLSKVASPSGLRILSNEKASN